MIVVWLRSTDFAHVMIGEDIDTTYDASHAGR